MTGQGLLTSLLITATFAWDPTGTQVAGRSSYYPLVVPAGNGSVFFGWEDWRAVPTRGADINIQHLTPAGMPVIGWPTGGASACASSSDEQFSSLAPDGAGGLYVFWSKDQRAEGHGLDAYVQRFGPDGLPYPSWPSYGVGIGTRPWDDQLARGCTDGQNGLFVVWEDSSPDAPFFSQHNCRAKRLLADGSTAPGWPDTGLAVSASPGGAQSLRRVVSDGQGGAYVVWWDARNTGHYEIYVQRLGPNGSVAPGWPTEGLLVCPVVSLKILLDAVSDGDHGLVLVWDDDRERPAGVDWTTPYGDIYAARLRPNGAHAAGWPLEGLPVCVSPGVQWNARMCPDGTGGAVMAWTDTRNHLGEIYVQRVLGNGQLAPGWPVNGLLAGTTPGEGVDPELASDGAGGAYLCWVDDTYYRSYAQHFLGSGAFAPGWPAAGVPLVDVATMGWQQTGLDITADGAGHAIVAWQDLRNDAAGNPQGSIRAQKLITDGLVPVQLALRTVEATSELVKLTWWGSREGESGLVVERSDDGAAWQRLGSPLELDTEQLSFTDVTVAPGTRYAYRMSSTDGRLIAGAQWVDVPAATRFALAGATPNPARTSELTVSFSLAARGAGALELLDLSGRRAAWRDIGTLGPGAHTIRMHEAAGLASGVYWLRLSQGPNRAQSRVVVIR
ncbi:MAG: hypothetical protein HZA61_12145 [Candidatus Eisenbacteria bacterium]|uniref:T9SS type A sorting domain-containing protein n=1 Tax=Eiseniibacteriota bacterium TaxID=2212470 RepID=A0A933W9R4_UNCEI|nr:hypothetical protein [Candidatus Eisenbacteria bacterium]